MADAAKLCSCSRLEVVDDVLVSGVCSCCPELSDELEEDGVPELASELSDKSDCEFEWANIVWLLRPCAVL